jgi:hypothetical protein
MYNSHGKCTLLKYDIYLMSVALKDMGIIFVQILGDEWLSINFHA